MGRRSIRNASGRDPGAIGADAGGAGRDVEMPRRRTSAAPRTQPSRRRNPFTLSSHHPFVQSHLTDRRRGADLQGLMPLPSSLPENDTRCRARRGRPMRSCSRASPRTSSAASRLVAIFTAEPSDTQRLEDELAFFAPDAARRRLPRLGDPPLRHLLAAPGPDLRAARHALAHPAGRGRRGADAGLDRTRPASRRRASSPAIPFTSRRSRSSTRRR